MKKIFGFVLCISLMLVPLMGAFCMENSSGFSENTKSKLKNGVVLVLNSSRAYKDGQEMYIDADDSAIKPIMIGDKTFVPARFIANCFDAKVDWDDVTSTATITMNSRILKLKANEKYIDINGEKSEIDTAVQMVNDRIMLPLRAVSNGMVKEVIWDDRRIIVISGNPNIKTDMDKNTMDEIVSVCQNSVYRKGYADMRKGDKIKVNLEKKVDQYTGRMVTKLTDDDYLSSRPYFYERSVTNDNRYAIISREVGQTNLYKLDMETGEVTQLTDRKAWQGKRGVEWPVLTADNKYLYYRYKAEIVRVNMETLEEEMVYKCVYGWWPSHYSVSSDGKYVAVSESWSDDLVNPYDFNKRWAAKPRSEVVYVNVETKEFKVIHEEKYWITHVLISPSDHNTVLFCHEGPWVEVDHRLWLVNADGKNLRCARPEQPGEGIGHEYFVDDGSAIGYLHFQDSMSNDHPTIRFLDVATLKETVVGPVSAWNHMFSNHDNSLIVADVMARSDPFLYLYNMKTKAEEKLCWSGTSGRDEPTHAHPTFSPNGKFVIYTSDVSGQICVYRVDLDPIYDIPKNTGTVAFKQDFEDSQPHGFKGSYANIEISQDTASSQSHSLHVFNRQQVSGGPRINVISNLAAGGKYNFRVKLKLKEGAEKSNARINLKISNGTQAKYVGLGSEKQITSEGWTELAGTYELTGPCDALEAYVDVKDIASEYYFDDFQIEQIGGTPAVNEPKDTSTGVDTKIANGTVVFNRDFEDSQPHGFKALYSNVEVSEGVASSQSHSLHVFNRQQVSGGPRINVISNLAVGGKYNFKVKLKLKEGAEKSNAKINLKISNGDQAKYVGLGSEKQIGSEAWTELVGTFELATACDALDVYLDVKDIAAEYYLDDFIIEKVSQ